MRTSIDLCQGVGAGLSESAEGVTLGLVKLANQSGFSSLAQYLWESSGVDDTADVGASDAPDLDAVTPTAGHRIAAAQVLSAHNVNQN